MTKKSDQSGEEGDVAQPDKADVFHAPGSYSPEGKGEQAVPMEGAPDQGDKPNIGETIDVTGDEIPQVGKQPDLPAEMPVQAGTALEPAVPVEMVNPPDDGE